MKRTVIFLTALCLMLAACVTPSRPITLPPTPAPGSPFLLAGTNWSLVSLALDGVTQTPNAIRIPTLDFSADGQIGGSGGCNSFGGNFTAQGEILSITQIRRTEMACIPNDVMAFEDAYLNALQGARLYEKRGNQLTITFAEGRGRLLLQAR